MNQYFNMMQRYYIVDDFYANPDMVRQFALSQEKNEKSDGNYAGIMTKEPFITQEHLDALSLLLNQQVKPSTSFCGKFRFTQGHEHHKQDIHFDPGDNNCAWAGVLYLTPNIQNTEGTIFWKHKRTGLEDIPRSIQGINQYGWKDVDDLKVFLETEGTDYSLWEKTFQVPYKYNRLVLFRPWMFHSPGPSFGNSLETARSIQTFFLSI